MSPVMMIVLGMTLVTYVPRLLPFLMISGKPLPVSFERFLTYVPYTALGALIIPGALQAIPGQPAVSLTALVFAVVCACFRGGIMLTVAGSIGIVYLLLLF